MAQLGGGGCDTCFRPPPAYIAYPLAPSLSFGSTDHSFGNNLTTYKKLYLLHTKMSLSVLRQNCCRPPQKFSSYAPDIEYYRVLTNTIPSQPQLLLLSSSTFNPLLQVVSSFGQLEKLLEKRGGQFLVGNNLTWADLQEPRYKSF